MPLRPVHGNDSQPSKIRERPNDGPSDERPWPDRCLGRSKSNTVMAPDPPYRSFGSHSRTAVVGSDVVIAVAAVAAGAAAAVAVAAAAAAVVDGMMRRRRQRRRGDDDEDEEQDDDDDKNSSSRSGARRRRTLQDELIGADSATATTSSGNTSGTVTATFTTIGVVRSVYKLCVGTPRQGLLAANARGRILLEYGTFQYAVDSLQQYSHLWVVFVFHRNTTGKKKRNGVVTKISPPALGGLSKVGVLATRSPHRFNPIGLSLVKLDRISTAVVATTESTPTTATAADDDNDDDAKLPKPTNPHQKRQQRKYVCLHVSGLDLVDGTPVLDVKPYVPAYDAPPNPPPVAHPPFPTPRTATTTASTATATTSTGGTRNENAKSGIQCFNNNESCDRPVGVVAVPDWVSDGLQARRSVVITDEAKQDLKRILDPALNTTNNNSKRKNVLDFYDNDEYDVVLRCIHEVLEVDVRSAWQTNKARQGRHRVERSSQLQEQQRRQQNHRQQQHPDAASEMQQQQSPPDASDYCTQQLDNLLIRYSVVSSNDNDQNTTTITASQGSGSLDAVTVTSIELLAVKERRMGDEGRGE